MFIRKIFGNKFMAFFCKFFNLNNFVSQQVLPDFNSNLRNDCYHRITTANEIIDLYEKYEYCSTQSLKISFPNKTSLLQ